MFENIEYLIELGYGSILVYDDNGNVIDESCCHYIPVGYDCCIFCSEPLSH